MKNVIAFGFLVFALLVGLKFMDPVQADKQPLPPLTASVQRTENLGIRVDTTRCVHASWSTNKDAGVFLSSGLGDAAVFYMGATDASWRAVLPEPDLNYQCFSRNAIACIRQGTAPDSCTLTFPLPQDIPAQPIMFMQEPDGGKPVVFGVSGTTGATADVECCPVIPVAARGR